MKRKKPSPWDTADWGIIIGAAGIVFLVICYFVDLMFKQ